MKFNFKLTYLPEGDETLLKLLEFHQEIIQIKALYCNDEKHVALCSSKSLAKSLKVSKAIGAELEILF